jgi:hypothetical protein
MFKITEKEIKAHGLSVKDIQKYARTDPGTWSHQKYRPINTYQILIYLLPSDTQDVGCTTVSVVGLNDVVAQRS